MYGSVVLLPLIFAKFFENTPFFIPNYQLPIANYQLEIANRPHTFPPKNAGGFLPF